MQDLIVLSHEEYLRLKCELKAAGLDLCYTAESARPIRMRWTPARRSDAAFLRRVAQRRPADLSYRIASVRCTHPGNWLWPAQLTVTFHAVSPRHDAALARYLATRPGSSDGQAQPAEAEHLSATPATYVQVAVLLALITAVEVAMLYVPESLRPPRWTVLVVLLLLSVGKFGIVVLYFMHLRYDHRLYASLFVGGLVIATGTVLALLVLFRTPAPRPAAATVVSSVVRPLLPTVLTPSVPHWLEQRTVYHTG
jgi:caa(3)-type oxidase subunit IV